MRYRSEIDGLRALSVIGVIVVHVDVSFGGTKLLPNGYYIGIDVFFVISGYLITRLIQKDVATEHFSLASLYRRRVR
ncbi:MAG: hypothetical protein COB78_13365 [Hyphomicrobiales bacterium]|nr:MAG: hypothetical protein COB78_13365 [Hyphomicrobiales bacterium]